jgi:uncharacterized protein YndB with AHSA1/START domain
MAAVTESTLADRELVISRIIDAPRMRVFQAWAEFTFTPQGDRTAVTWSMSGTQNFMAKAFCMFMSMDKMVGGEFEKGLAQMKSVAESANKT